MTSTSDHWLHFHQSNSSAASQMATPYAATSPSDLFFSGQVSEATTVSTTINPINNPPSTGPAQLGPNSSKVSKPARKRTRASRRTPTTLLNTDTSNFRAMVQQFTGGPSNNFDIPGPGPQIYSNGLGAGYGFQLPLGQLQHPGVPGLGPLQYSMSSNNSSNNNSSNSNSNSNNIMFMQRIGETFTTDGSNISVNTRLTGTGGRSSSSENRSINNFQF